MRRSIGTWRIHLGLSGLIWCSALFGAAAAFAGDAKCLWRNLPLSSRNGLLAAYAERGSDGMAATNVSNEQIRSIVQSCIGHTPTDEEASAAGGALVGQALMEAAAAKLQTAFGVTPAKLSAAWSVMSPTARSMLLQQFSGSETTSDEDADMYAVIRTTALSLGWKAADPQPLDDPEFTAIADYVTGRAQAEAFERKF